MKKRKSSVKETKPAKGVRGTILLIPEESPVFRVYRHDREYRIEQMAKREAGQRYNKKAWDHTDYEIEHFDFDVTIDEEFAVLYALKNGRRIFDFPIR